MRVIYALLLVAAFVSFVVAAFNPRPLRGYQVHLVALGLACWALVETIQMFKSIDD